MENEELKRDLEFYKKRFENSQKEKDVLKKESQALRQEMNSMKDFVKKIVVPKKGVDPKSADHSLDKNDMLTILDFQRKRIDELEKDSEDLKKKYEKLLFDKKTEEEKAKPASVALADASLSAEAALEKAYERIALLESKLKDVTSGYAKEVTNLRNKLVESQASEILNTKAGGDQMDLLNKSSSLSTFKKRDPLLQPIKADKANFFSPSQSGSGMGFKSEGLVEDPQAGLFSYKARTNSRQNLPK